jgi:hypothetical protein
MTPSFDAPTRWASIVAIVSVTGALGALYFPLL